MDHGFHREHDVCTVGRMEMGHSRRNDVIVHVLVLQLSHHILQSRTVTALTCASGSACRDNEVDEWR